MYNKKKKIKHKTLKIFCLLIGMIVTAVFLEAGILYLVNSQNVYKTSKVLLDQTIEIVEKNKQSEVGTVVADIPITAKCSPICALARSEERRVGKECSEPCRSRWSPYH